MSSNLYKNEFRSYPRWVKEFSKIRKKINFQDLIAIMYEKGKFAKIKKSSIGNISIEAANICNILQGAPDSNALIVVKLKWDLKYRGYVYF